MVLQGYQNLQFLGSGAYGSVYKVKRQSDAKIFACKIIQLGNTRIDHARNEIQLLQSLNHPHIVNIEHWAFSQNSNTLHIFMNFCNGGDLESLIRTHKQSGTPITVQRILSFTRQMSLALAYMHNPSTGRVILHRDLKPANVLLVNRQPGYMPIIKLADFGQAGALDGINGTLCGTLDYFAPELLAALAKSRPLPSSTKSDIYALGKIVDELYHAAGSEGTVSIAVQKLYGACLKAEPAKRPPAQQVANWCQSHQ